MNKKEESYQRVMGYEVRYKALMNRTPQLNAYKFLQPIKSGIHKSNNAIDRTNILEAPDIKPVIS